MLTKKTKAKIPKATKSRYEAVKKDKEFNTKTPIASRSKTGMKILQSILLPDLVFSILKR